MQYPVRERCLQRNSMTQFELNSKLSERLCLASDLSPIQQDASESFSSAGALSSSLTFRRSQSLPLESPQHINRDYELSAKHDSPSENEDPGVDDSFSSLTLPSPNTLVCKNLFTRYIPAMITLDGFQNIHVTHGLFKTCRLTSSSTAGNRPAPC